MWWFWITWAIVAVFMVSRRRVPTTKAIIVLALAGAATGWVVSVM